MFKIYHVYAHDAYDYLADYGYFLYKERAEVRLKEIKESDNIWKEYADIEEIKVIESNTIRA